MDRFVNVNLSEAWVLLCAALVFFMQAGYCCLEAGLSRSKNSIDAAIRVLLDFSLATCVYWVCGFAFMFGDSGYGFAGTNLFFFQDLNPTHMGECNFVFQLGCCGVAVTIVSGAVAERMRFLPYLSLVVLISGVVYPLFGHWAWAYSGSSDFPNIVDPNGFLTNYTGWLGGRGFRDFAGATVVHSLGAWVALTAIMMVGPRDGKFFADKKPRKIVGHNFPLATLGVFILWMGWFGLAGGRTYAPNAVGPPIFVNLMLAAASGGIAALILDCLIQRHKLPDQPANLSPFKNLIYSPESILNGVLAGLVAISAGCNVLSHNWAVVVGVVAAGLMFASTWALELFRLDDAVGAVASHGVAGAWGTIALGLFYDTHILIFQVIGVLVCFVFAVTVTAAFLAIVRLVGKMWHNTIEWDYILRLSPREQAVGTNRLQHGWTTEYDDIFSTIEKQIAGEARARVPVEDEHSPGGLVGISFNKLLDELEAKQADLQRAREEADQAELEKMAADEASRANTAFVRKMSHEMRTPLTSMLLAAERLSRSLKEQRFKDLAQGVTEDGQQLLKLIDHLLELARIEAGTLSIEPDQLDTHSFFREITRSASARCEKKGVSFEHAIASGFPGTIVADRARLRQILDNLIGNAVKFTEIGGTIRLTASQSNWNSQPALQFDVSDTGIGIPEDMTGKIFEEFQQVDPKKMLSAGIEGVGLGLAISRELARKMGGDITVASEVNRGSTFTVFIPCIEAEPEAVDRPVEFEGSFEGVRVLLVEDSPRISALVTDLLKEKGAAVETTENGRAALERALPALLDDHPFDLVLMDVRMPVMDGHEASRKLRLGGFTRPIIAVTAHTSADDERKCLKAGCNDYIKKPIDENDLWTKFQRLLAAADAEDDGFLHSTESDHHTIKRHVPKFVEGIANDIAGIEKELQKRDPEELYEKLHEFVGAAEYNGFSHTTPLTRGILERLKQRPIDWDEIGADVGRLIEALRRFRAGRAPAAPD